MGGYGSGRHRTNLKSTVSDYFCLDVNSMNRQGLLERGLVSG